MASELKANSFQEKYKNKRRYRTERVRASREVLTDTIQDTNMMKKRIYQTAYKYDMVQTLK